MELKNKFRHIPDFPKEGIDFIDITTVLNDSEAFTEAIDLIANEIDCDNCDVIVGSEARGFILGAAVAYKLGKRFVPVRKPGKLPYKTIKGSYALEYAKNNNIKLIALIVAALVVVIALFNIFKSFCCRLNCEVQNQCEKPRRI